MNKALGAGILAFGLIYANNLIAQDSGNLYALNPHHISRFSYVDKDHNKVLSTGDEFKLEDIINLDNKKYVLNIEGSVESFFFDVSMIRLYKGQKLMSEIFFENKRIVIQNYTFHDRTSYFISAKACKKVFETTYGFNSSDVGLSKTLDIFGHLTKVISYSNNLIKKAGTERGFGVVMPKYGNFLYPFTSFEPERLSKNE